MMVHSREGSPHYGPEPDGGFVQFSPVGFDRAGRHAILFVAHTCGGDCGTGHFVTLTREDKWRVVQSYLAFIS